MKRFLSTTQVNQLAESSTETYHHFWCVMCHTFSCFSIYDTDDQKRCFLTSFLLARGVVSPIRLCNEEPTFSSCTIMLYRLICSSVSTNRADTYSADFTILNGNMVTVNGLCVLLNFTGLLVPL